MFGMHFIFVTAVNANFV